MQFNQLFGKPTFDSRNYNAYYQTLPSYIVIGEGEVNSVLIPDGSVQMYFIPTFRYDRWPLYPYINNNINKEHSIESWFIRSISLPMSSTISNQYSNPYGDRLSTQLSPDYNAALPFCSEFRQKFHNDNATSTTDISYFYPSLRQNKVLLNNALVQTNTATPNCNVSYEGRHKQCNCKVSFRIEKETNGKCVCLESASAMSVDSVRNKSSDQSVDKKHRRSKHKRQNRRRRGRDHACECKVGVESTADKLVTTYEDRACGRVRRDTPTGRKSKRSDIRTEIWVPVKGKRTKAKSSIDSLNELPCCSNSVWTFSSTSNTDSQ